MSKNVTMAKGGSDEKTLPIEEIQIADLWHCAMTLQEGKAGRGKQAQKALAEQILSVWHLAHDLKRHIQEGD